MRNAPRFALMLAPALIAMACAHATTVNVPPHSDLPPDTAFRVHSHVGEQPVRVGLILTPPGELPVWSCEAEARGDSFACPAATDWFRGPGRYELLVELRSEREVIRAVHTLDVASDGPVAVSLWLVEEGKRHLELASGTPDQPPSASAQGSLSGKRILPIIKQSEPEFRGCFAGALQDTPELEKSRIETWFLIAPDGKVEGVSARGAENTPELAYCLLARLRGLVFPPPEGGGVAVTYPMVFAR